jgi:hypothetical protein
VTYSDGITAMAASCDILNLAQSKQVCKRSGFCSARFCATNLLFDDFGGFLLALFIALKYL